MPKKYNGYDVQFMVEDMDKSPCARRESVVLIGGYSTLDTIPRILAIAVGIGVDNAHRVNVYSISKNYEGDSYPSGTTSPHSSRRSAERTLSEAIPFWNDWLGGESS